MPPIKPKLIINLIKKAKTLTTKSQPTLIGSQVRGSQLFLEFDNRLGGKPSKELIKEYAQSKGFDADVLQFKGGLGQELTLGGLKDTTRFRLDVFGEGRPSSEAASELSKAFGGNFSTRSAKVGGLGIGKTEAQPKLLYQKWSEGKAKLLPNLEPSLERRVRFEGIQEQFLGMSKEGKIMTKPGAFTFTDKKGGSTFMVPLEKDTNWEVWKTLQRMDKQNFGQGGK